MFEFINFFIVIVCCAIIAYCIRSIYYVKGFTKGYYKGYRHGSDDLLQALYVLNIVDKKEMIKKINEVEAELMGNKKT